jgi:bifunctional UDP-N-acetylglucosamine pyrophosphorylase/glucosamine-1-phosphate N-acetyltransferase
MEQRYSFIILAAGFGTRMKSKKIKVLHKIFGKPLIHYLYEEIIKLNPKKIVTVVGYQKEKVIKALTRFDTEFVVQEKQLGTGHAVLCTKEKLSNFNGDIIIIYGDIPLIKAKTISKLINVHRKNKWGLTVATMNIANPNGYGRIIIDKNNRILKIVEEVELKNHEKNINCVNTGIYCASSKFLYNALDKLKLHKSKNEIFLTDIIELGAKKKLVGNFHLKDGRETLGVNSREDLKLIIKIIKESRN